MKLRWKFAPGGKIMGRSIRENGRGNKFGWNAGEKKELAINLPSVIVTEKECPVWRVYPMGSSSISQENLQRKGLKI